MTTANSSVFLISAALSPTCITLNPSVLDDLSIANALSSSTIVSLEVPLRENYSTRVSPVSNGTFSSENALVGEYNVLASFANKILSNESTIDPEIQNIIDEYFWDML